MPLGKMTKWKKEVPCRTQIVVRQGCYHRYKAMVAVKITAEESYNQNDKENLNQEILKESSSGPWPFEWMNKADKLGEEIIAPIILLCGFMYLINAVVKRLLY